MISVPRSTSARASRSSRPMTPPVGLQGNIQPSGIRKYFDLLQGMEGGISLGIGEPDFPTPWHIRDAGIFSLEKGFTK